MTHHTPGIVVGVDGSAGGRGAVRWALHEALHRECSVEVVHCWHPRTSDDTPFVPLKDLRSGSEQLLQHEIAAVASTLPALPELTLTSAHGRPIPTLVTASQHAGLLVVGARTPGGSGPLPSAQVAQGCLRHARCPVVVVDATGAVAHDPASAVPVVAVAEPIRRPAVEPAPTV